MLVGLVIGAGLLALISTSATLLWFLLPPAILFARFCSQGLLQRRSRSPPGRPRSLVGARCLSPSHSITPPTTIWSTLYDAIYGARTSKPTQSPCGSSGPATTSTPPAACKLHLSDRPGDQRAQARSARRSSPAARGTVAGVNVPGSGRCRCSISPKATQRGVPLLTEDQIQLFRRVGKGRTFETGEILFPAGRPDDRLPRRPRWAHRDPRRPRPTRRAPDR